MKTSYFMDVFKRLEKFAVKHTPEILAGIGISGFTTSIVLAVKATPKAQELIEEKKQEIAEEQATTGLVKNSDVVLSPMETIKVAWKPYVPVVITAASSALCVIGSVSTSLRRNAALTTALEISRTFADEYKAKVVEVVGKNKEKKIQEAIAQERIEKNPPVTGVNLIAPGEDGVHRLLFYETITKKFFWAKKEDVDKAIIKFFKEMKSEWSSTYSVYSWLTLLESFGIKIMSGFPDGELDKYMNIGWETSSMYTNDLVEADLKLVTVYGGEWDGYPVYNIEYSITPSTLDEY